MSQVARRKEALAAEAGEDLCTKCAVLAADIATASAGGR